MSFSQETPHSPHSLFSPPQGFPLKNGKSIGSREPRSPVDVDQKASLLEQRATERKMKTPSLRSSSAEEMQKIQVQTESIMFCFYVFIYVDMWIFKITSDKLPN